MLLSIETRNKIISIEKKIIEVSVFNKRNILLFVHQSAVRIFVLVYIYILSDYENQSPLHSLTCIAAWN